MAWMNFRGNMYHCIHCNLAVAADYQDGPRRIRVDDVDKIIQEHLHKKYMFPSYDLKKEGYFVHTGTLCKGCLPPHLNKSTVVYSKGEKPLFEKAVFLVEKFAEETKELLDRSVVQYASRFDSEYCIDIFSGSIEKPGKQNLIVQKEYFKEAKNLIAYDFRNYLESSRDTKKHIQELHESISQYKPMLRALLDQGKNQYFEPIHYEDAVVSCSNCAVNLKALAPDQAIGRNELFRGPCKIPRFRIIRFLEKDWFDHVFTTNLRSKLFAEINKKARIRAKFLSEGKIATIPCLQPEQKECSSCYKYRHKLEFLSEKTKEITYKKKDFVTII